MKRCPKCNRTYPDDNQKFCTLDGTSLVSADQGFDPNATILSTQNLASQAPPQPPPVDSNRTVALPSTPPDPGRTIASTPSSSTDQLNAHTGPMSAATVVDRPAPTSAPPVQSAPLPQAPQPTATPGAPKSKSKAPLIIGVLLVLLVLGAGAIAAAYFVVIRPRMSPTEPTREVVVNNNENTNTVANENANVATQPPAESAYVPPPGTVKFTNSSADVDQQLSEHYVGFSFYYPEGWKISPQRGVFVNLEKTEEDDKGVYVVENASVSWYNSTGTFDGDIAVFPDRVRSMQTQTAARYPGYRKLSEGETSVNALKAYEFKFTGIGDTGKGELPYWGRVIFIPPGENHTKGAVITLLATGLSKDVTGADQLGQTGDAAVILESFRFGKDN